MFSWNGNERARHAVYTTILYPVPGDGGVAVVRRSVLQTRPTPGAVSGAGPTLLLAAPQDTEHVWRINDATAY